MRRSGESHVAGMDEMAESDGYLNIPHYVDPVTAEEPLTVAGTMEHL